MKEDKDLEREYVEAIPGPPFKLSKEAFEQIKNSGRNETALKRVHKNAENFAKIIVNNNPRDQEEPGPSFQ